MHSFVHLLLLYQIMIHVLHPRNLRILSETTELDFLSLLFTNLLMVDWENGLSAKEGITCNLLTDYDSTVD